MTTDIQQLENILTRNKLSEVFPFLEKLDHKQRRNLAKEIEHIEKRHKLTSDSWSVWGVNNRKTKEQIIDATKFVCYTASEFKRKGSHWLDQSLIERVFKFYIPDWFGDFMNETAERDFWAVFNMDYKWMMELYKRKVFNPSPQLIVKHLPKFIFNLNVKKNKYVDFLNEKNLLLYPETLDEHIWLLFSYDSRINWMQTSVTLSNGNDQFVDWKDIFKKLADEGKIDRKKLLTHCLSATIMNFNKLLTQWFIDLFVHLEPTEEEELELQNDMMAVFNSAHSKPVNVMLNHFKKLCVHKTFQLADFLEYSNVLITSEVKGVVNSTLMILDKAARKHQDKTSEICQTASQAFLHADAAIQKRTAKLIAKYGNVEDEQLLASISTFSESILFEAREQLASFIPQEFLEQNADFEGDTMLVIEEVNEVLAPENQITIPENIDDLMFLASQAFDNNDPAHIDIFQDALVRLNGELDGENIDRFEPALQRAFKIVTEDWRANMGSLDHMLAIFFIEYACVLMRRFPDGGKKLKKLYKKYVASETEHSVQYSRNKFRIYPLIRWTPFCKSRIYEPFQLKMLEALALIKAQVKLPLLSTPTHQSSWIDPEILLERVLQWQKAGKDVPHMDMQIAMSRTCLKDTAHLLPRVMTELIGETRELLYFLFEKDAKPVGPFRNQAHWFTAALTKNPEVVYDEFKDFAYSQTERVKFTGQYNWKVLSEPFQTQRWDYKKNGYVDYKDYRRVLRIDIDKSKQQKVVPFFKRVLTQLMTPNEQKCMLYEAVHIQVDWALAMKNDVARLYSLYPNNPENLIAKFTDLNFRDANFFGEDNKKISLNLLEKLTTHPLPLGNMAHLFVAACMLSSDKTVRALAGELWIQSTRTQQINNEKLGEYIGKHFSIEFVPLKRFTDLLTENMLNISAYHNEQLQDLIENILLHLPVEPIKGLKKLLEIYLEIVSRTNKQSPEVLNAKMDDWASTKSLTKVLSLVAC